MDIELLNRAMRAEARGLGLCDQWFGEWADDADVDELLNKYTRGIDFVIGKKFPGNDVLKKYATKEKLHEHGIYIDEKVDKTATNSPSTILNGTCDGKLTYGSFSVANIYVRDSCDITIEVFDFAKVFVEVYDDARVSFINRGNSRCFVYQHGGEVKTQGDVLVRDKMKNQS